jgi:hypothetical protein
MPSGNPTSILMALLLAGLLGTLGQGVRALAGLKKMNDDASAQTANSTDLFIASRLIVSLLIGFLAGVAAGLALGLDKLLGMNSSNLELMLGISAAGYAGADFIEAFAPTIVKRAQTALPVQMRGENIQARNTQSGPIASQPQIGPALVPAGVLNTKYGVVFASLVTNGFFSADPDDPRVRRSIRTNNPGALNFSDWQMRRLGFVGVSQPDNSPDANVTTIYRTPEHGIAAWYHLVVKGYQFPGGNFSLDDLAKRYAGSNNTAAIPGYVAGWNKWLNPPLPPTTSISVDNLASMRNLAKAMFSHEAGMATPLHDDQIDYALQQERAGTLPA